MADEHPADKIVPGVVCNGIAVDKNGRILLVKSERWKNHYALPGGHVEYGERVADAVVREMKEETNLDVTDLEFVRWGEFIFENDYYQKRHFVYFSYSCKSKSDAVKLNEEAQSFLWVKPEEALILPLADYARTCITEYIRKGNTK